MDASKALHALRGRTGELVEDLVALVETESPSSDGSACSRACEAVAALGERLLGASPVWHPTGDRSVLEWRFGDRADVVLLGHIDTVWPLGTLARWPVSATSERVEGPGVFDMKAGLVQGFHALAELEDREGIAFVINADEETGSQSSRAVLERALSGARAALVLEPSAAGAVKTARKGVSVYELLVHGRAAHAGLDPGSGINATVELAHQVLQVAALGSSELGTDVTPTVAASGTTRNTVPALARLEIDVRVRTTDEQERVDSELRALRPRTGATLELRGGPNRPPMPASSSAGLFETAREIAARLELGPLAGVEVGGGSDGNFAAAAGVPTLDGLGAVGGHAHAEGEYVEVGAMAERAALVAVLADGLRR